MGNLVLEGIYSLHTCFTNQILGLFHTRCSGAMFVKLCVFLYSTNMHCLLKMHMGAINPLFACIFAPTKMHCTVGTMHFDGAQLKNHDNTFLPVSRAYMSLLKTPNVGTCKKRCTSLYKQALKVVCPMLCAILKDALTKKELNTALQVQGSKPPLEKLSP